MIERFQKRPSLPPPDSGPAVWVERIHAQGPDEYPLGLEVSTGKGSEALHETLEPDRSSVDVPAGGEAIGTFK